MKRFLLISYAFPPMGVVGALRPYRICRYSLPGGWLAEVITTNPRAGLPLDPTLLESLQASIRVHRTKTFEPLLWYRQWRQGAGNPVAREGEEAAGIQQPGPRGHPERSRRAISRLKDALVGLVSTPDRQVFWTLFAICRGVRILRRQKDVAFILTTSPPHSAQLAGCLLSRLFRRPHLVDLRDPWMGVSYLDKSRLRLRLESRLESWVIRCAARVISTSGGYTRMLREAYPGLPAERFLTLTNGFEPEKFAGIPGEQWPKFTIGYVGIFYPALAPYAFFQALAGWAQKHPQARAETEMVIVGNPDLVTESVIRRYGLTGMVRVTGRVAHAEAIHQAKSCDLLLLCTGTGPRTPRGWIPSKLLEYLACGKPILANVPEGDAASIVRRTRTGYVVTSDDPLAMECILDLEFARKKDGSQFQGPPFDPDLDEIRRYAADGIIKETLRLFEAVAAENRRAAGPGHPGG